MRLPDRPFAFQALDMALLRAAILSDLSLPALPDYHDPASAASDVGWLREVWANDEVREAIAHAAPAFAEQIDALCHAARPEPKAVQRATSSMIRYLQRFQRPTPFGHIAGVAAARIGRTPQWDWGAAHTAIARPAAAWLSALIADLERHEDLQPHLTVMANSTMHVRGNYLIVPYLARGRATDNTAAVDVRLRHTRQARFAIDAAAQPIQVRELGGAILAAFPAATREQVTTMLATLIDRRALLTSLHAPSTQPDAMGHLLHELHTARAGTLPDLGGLVESLTVIHADLEAHNRLSAKESRPIRDRVTAAMRAIAYAEPHPLAIDMRLDASPTLPESVLREVERAARVLAIVSSQPFGSPSWKAYHQRFYERFGIGSLVPVADVIADSGIGWPDGYPNTATPPGTPPSSKRDTLLLQLAQGAALDGHDGIALDDDLIRRLDKSEGKTRPPGHLEMRFRINANDAAALRRGEFTIEVVSVSSAAGVLVGRFLTVLDPGDRDRFAAQLSRLPASDADTVIAQVSFPPLRPSDAHVARAVPTQPITISLAEHRPAGDTVLHLSDLAVGCDGKRLYLAAPERGHRVEAIGMHALNLRLHTPPLARYLIELSHAQHTQVTMFDWGAASELPYLPRVTYGRIVLATARWRVSAADLPTRQSPWDAWESVWHELQKRRRIPQSVRLVGPGSDLPLDLAEPWHRAILRDHLNKQQHAVIAEASTDSDSGWCDGRPHEFVVPLTCTQPAAWPRLPLPTRARTIGRDHADPPGNSAVLMAKLYGDLGRQTELLTAHLHTLFDGWESAPSWWYLRFRDPDQHIRLRITLDSPDAFGPAAQRVSRWATGLHRSGLLREVVFPTSYSETGRWGSGPAMQAAEAVFGHDSRAVIVQLSTGLGAQSDWPHRQALIAAQFVAIVIAFSGCVHSGMRWLIEQIPARSPARPRRLLLDEAVRTCNPDGDWEALRALTGGQAIVEAWQPRAAALAAYRTHFPGPHTEGINVNDVLGSLLHAHFVRSVGIDFDQEAMCLYLARSAAMAYQAGARRSR